MAHEYPKIPEDQHDRILQEKILQHPDFLDVTRQESPRAIIMAGQPGAGKGGLVRAALAELGGDAVTVDPDELRDYHPQVNNLRQLHPYTWSGETHGDASVWANELRDAAVSERKNIILDTTVPRTDIIKDLQAQGYEVEIRAIATHRLESELGVDKRFSEQLIDKGYGRYVPQELRDKVYLQLPSQLDAVSSKTGAPIHIFDRQGQSLYDSVKQPDLSPRQALEAAREARMTPQRLAEVEQGIQKQQQFHREIPSQLPNAQIDATTADSLLRERQVAQVEPRLNRLAESARTHVPHLATRSGSVAQELGTAERTAQTPHARLPPGSVLKGLGVAGTVYGVAQGINDTRGAIDQARSNREQWVRGGEAGADVAARGTVTGAAATVGTIPGAAVGALTSPVTGPVGPVAGALASGGAAAYGADKAYEDSRLQALAKSFGRDVGALGYDYISREGRLLREVNGLKEDLQSETDPSRRQALESRLSGANGRFGVEVERNGRYFEGRGTIESHWDSTHTQFPKLDHDDVTKALSRHIDAGKPATEAANAAYSDALHEKYPRARPHQPQENYRALSNEQLLEKHGSYTTKLVEDRREAMTQASTVDSRNSIDQGWPKELAQQRQAGRVEESLNAVWKDAGHVSAIRGAMQERGMKPPELPAALRERAVNSPEHGPDNANKPAAPVSTNARDAFRAQENLDRRNEAAVSSDFSRATAATHQHQFKVAETALTPGLRSRGLDREEIDRVSAATVSHTQQNAQRGGIQGIYLSKDGQRVAVRQDTPPIGEFNVNTALTQTGEQHLERAQLLAQSQSQSRTHSQAQAQIQDPSERGQTHAPSQVLTPASAPAPTETPPNRSMA